MKNKITKAAYVFLLTICIFLFASCASGNISNSSSNIVGTWRYDLNEDYRDLITEFIQDPTVYNSIFYEFNEDGTGATYNLLNPTPVNFTYEYDGSKLIVLMGTSQFDIDCVVKGNKMIIVENGDEVEFKRQ